ncbi:hypothetical protein [Vibrio sp. PID17_43]|uniref:hypothetical protein n=1 Tax=Vibrio sp. PID17_43 TaxID=1583451 RepID=UPI000BFFC986|nr:hypothetical protein [Vibrio sp. PID17_43]PHJ40599.1 hypothetical protein AK965_16175 [Vibrio sp. PID17_43]
MKTIRLFYRHFNINTTRAGTAKLLKTLRHSLRILHKDNSKKLEWDESLSSGNLIWANGMTKHLDDYSLEERQTIFDGIIPSAKLKNESRLKDQRRQLRHKVKKMCDTEQKSGNEHAAYLLEKIYLQGHNEKVPETPISHLESLTPPMARHQQKMKTVRKFARLHNQLVNAKPNVNSTYLQEGIFKIPHRWKVDDNIITPEEWLEYTKGCLKHFFPNYPIHALVVHVDERLKNELTGAHCHYFLSGQESVFGNWDLLKTQIEVVNQFIDSKNRSLIEQKKELEKQGKFEESEKLEDLEELLPENCTLTREQSAIHGERLQRMFYEHINHHFLNPKGLHAEVSSEEERETLEYKQMARQAPLAKSGRDYNYESRLVEELKKERLLLEQTATDEENKIVRLVSQREQLTSEMTENESIFEWQKSQQQEELEQLKRSNRELRFEAIRLRNIAEKISGNLRDELTAIIRQAYIAVQYQQRGQQQKANDYFNQLTQRLDNEMDLDIKPIIQSVIDAIESTNLDDSNNEVTYD